MNRNPSNTRWLTCGAIVLVLGCIGLVVGFGGLAAIGALFDESAPTLQAANPTITSLPANSSSAAGDPGQPTPLPILKAIPFESVVQIVTFYYDDNNRLIPGWTGSGTVISPDGLILTNSHVVLPDRFFPVDALGVAFSSAEDQPPQLRYYAEVMQVDESLDIAVIRISSDMNGSLLDNAALNLPYVPLGDADALRLGDAITILGYPGIGGQTITLTRGEVSGFTAEGNRGPRAFIKTSATIAGGNSGGLAADAEGYLIGIPTQLGYGGDDQYVDCRVLADTNRDGFVDDQDNCVPTGGFINALRPINLALPLIEAAREGLVAVHHSDPAASSPSGLPQEGQIVYSTDFSTPSDGWGFTGEYSSTTVQDGLLEIEINTTEYLTWGLAEINATDVIIHADAQVRVSALDGDFGILCRYANQSNYYALEVSEDGYYTIYKRLAGEDYSLVEWTPSELVTTTNEVQISAACIGESLQLFLNGSLLAEATDTDLTSGDVGLIAGTWEGIPLLVEFDNFIVRRPAN
jgi:S1-C subfamily serine protease